MRIQQNNKGMSLLELLIAIAIASVVSLLIASMMTNGTSMFTRESDRIDVQNDLQVVQNQLTQKLMEAQEINIVKVKNSDDFRIYTGKIDSTDGKSVIKEKGTGCIITYYDDKLYITSDYVADMSTVSEGFLLSDNVLSFKLDIANEKKTATVWVEQADGTIVENVSEYYDNPISISIKMQVSDSKDKNKKTVEEIVKLRNKINEYNIFEVDSFADGISFNGDTPNHDPQEILDIR